VEEELYNREKKTGLIWWFNGESSCYNN